MAKRAGKNIRTMPTSVKLTEDVFVALQYVAQRLDRSVSWVIREYIKEGLIRDEDLGKK